MPIDRINDLRAFRDFADARLTRDDETTLDEALDLWRAENEDASPSFSNDVAAVREALDDMRAGDLGIPLREAVAELRRKHDPATRS